MLQIVLTNQYILPYLSSKKKEKKKKRSYYYLSVSYVNFHPGTQAVTLLFSVILLLHD